MTTIDVQSHGATPGDSSNDRVAINAAINASSPDDTILFTGSGHYYCKGTDFILAKSGRVMKCEPTAYLKRDETSANPSTCIYGEDLVGASFHSMRIDQAKVSGGTKFRKGVYLLNFEACEFINCHFWDSGSIDPEDTPMAILAQVGSQLLIKGCTFDDVQAKLGGGAGGIHGVAFLDNVSNRPRQYAISAVARSEGARVRDILIRDCSIVDPAGSGGIYIGDDTEDESEVYDMQFSDIVIENVDVTGTWRSDSDSQVKIINGRPRAGSENWIVRNVSGVASNATKPSSSQGFVFYPRDRVTDEIPSLKGLFMRDCYAEKLDLEGIRLAGWITDIDIRDCVVHNTRGVDIRGNTRHGPQGRIEVEITGGGDFSIYAHLGNVGPLHVRTNVVPKIYEANGYTANVVIEPW